MTGLLPPTVSNMVAQDATAKALKSSSAPKSTSTSTSSAPCHMGNVTLLTLPNKAMLQVGGWSRHANYDGNTVVIDLTGHEKPDEDDIQELLDGTFFENFVESAAITKPAGWLSFPIKDYSVPDYLNRSHWDALSDDIWNILAGGNDVLIACQGGHGRTGMVASILMGIYAADQQANAHDPAWKGVEIIDPGYLKEPVRTLRKKYCNNVVDTLSQEKYVYQVLELDTVPDEKAYKSYSSAGGSYSTYGSTKVWRTCKICNHVKQDDHIEMYGMCADCQKKAKDKIRKEAKETKQPKESIILWDENTGHCWCGDTKCSGVHLSTCGHVVHGQDKAYMDICDPCWRKQKADEEKKAKNKPGIIQSLLPDKSEHFTNEHGVLHYHDIEY